MKITRTVKKTTAIFDVGGEEKTFVWVQNAVPTDLEILATLLQEYGRTFENVRVKTADVKIGMLLEDFIAGSDELVEYEDEGERKISE